MPENSQFHDESSTLIQLRRTLLSYRLLQAMTAILVLMFGTMWLMFLPRDTDYSLGFFDVVIGAVGGAAIIGAIVYIKDILRKRIRRQEEAANLQIERELIDAVREEEDGLSVHNMDTRLRSLKNEIGVLSAPSVEKIFRQLLEDKTIVIIGKKYYHKNHDVFDDLETLKKQVSELQGRIEITQIGEKTEDNGMRSLSSQGTIRPLPEAFESEEDKKEEEEE